MQSEIVRSENTNELNDRITLYMIECTQTCIESDRFKPVQLVVGKQSHVIEHQDFSAVFLTL